MIITTARWKLSYHFMWAKLIWEFIIAVSIFYHLEVIERKSDLPLIEYLLNYQLNWFFVNFGVNKFCQICLKVHCSKEVSHQKMRGVNCPESSNLHWSCFVCGRDTLLKQNDILDRGNLNFRRIYRILYHVVYFISAL